MEVFQCPLNTGFSEDLTSIQTRKFETSSIQFCIGVFVLFGFIFVQLS